MPFRLFQIRRFSIAYNFASDRRGTISIMFAMCLVSLCGFLGLALDFGRAHLTASKVAAAIDAASLATAKAMIAGNLTDAEVIKVGTDFFYANVSDVAGDGVTYKNLVVNADRTNNIVEIKADAEIEAYFGPVFNIKKLFASRASTAVLEANDIELGLMLDVTGSMGASGKLDSLKLAVKDLVDIMIPDNPVPNSIRIGLAPYSASVNLGPLSNLVSNGQSTDGCVVGRTGLATNDDTPPATGSYFPTIAQANAVMTNDTGRPGYGFYRCPPATVLPLTDKKSVLKSTVDSYAAAGRTGGHLGIGWAWYLVSPNWAGVWGNASAPEPYGKKKLIKAVVLMTDGEFNASYGGSDAWGDAVSLSYANSASLCAAMKSPSRQILIFSVGFKLNQQSAIDALTDCASDKLNNQGVVIGKHIYLAENEAELRSAFRDIAIKLTELRLSK